MKFDASGVPLFFGLIAGYNFSLPSIQEDHINIIHDSHASLAAAAITSKHIY